MPAGAHEAKHPKRAALRLTPERIVLQLELAVAPGEPARGLRAALGGEKLADHLARTAALPVKLWIDGAQVPLARGPASVEDRGEIVGRVELSAPWPPGSGDWLGRRRLRIEDEGPAGAGHVPVAVSCSGCAISSSSGGVFHRDAHLVEHVVGAQMSREAPLEVRVRIGRPGLSCGG